MQDIQQFESEQFGTIRTTTIEGEPWFVAKDVCDALSIRSDTVRNILDDDEVSETNPNTIGVTGGRKPLIISEAGLYGLVLKSRKPEAKAFKRWVTHEVLPSIRRHGMYATPQTVDEMLADPDTMIRTLQALKAERERADRLEERNAKQAEQIDEMRPKALFADAVSASDGTCLVGEVAKMLRQTGVDVGQNRLFKWLRRDGILGKSGSNKNVPTQYAMENGWFKIKETTVVHSDGHVTLSRTPKVTGRGQRYLINKYGGDM